MLEQARQTADPVALAEALSLAHHCLLGPDHAEMRLGLAEELMREGSRTGRPSDVSMGLLWRTVDLFMLGDPHAERYFTELCGSGRAHRHAAVGFVMSAMRVMLDIRSGRLAEAERLAVECAERGRAAGDADADGWYGAQLVAIRFYQGRIGELVATLTEFANSPAQSAIDNAFLAALAVAAARAGDRRRAHGALARICGEDLGRLPRSSSSWLVAITGVIEAAALLGNIPTAARAYDLLLPYARLPIVGSLGIVCFGSAHHPLGVASLTVGEPSQAVAHLRMAVRHNTALGHWPAATLSRHRLGQALAASGDLGSATAELTAAAREAELLVMALPAQPIDVATGWGWGLGGAAVPSWTRRRRSDDAAPRPVVVEDTTAPVPVHRQTGVGMGINLLGPVGLWVNGSEVTVGGRQAQAVLALLATRADEVLTLDWLVDQLWLRRPPRTARATVQSHVSRLRAAAGPLGQRQLRRQCTGYLLDTSIAEDRHLPLRATRPPRTRTCRRRPVADALAELQSALALWRGTPFTAIDDVPALDTERGRLEELRSEARLCELEALLRTGRPDRAVEPLRRFTSDRQWDERGWRLLMLALYRTGRQAEALHAAADARQLLVSELGLDPTPALAQLEREILNHDTAAHDHISHTRSA